MVSKAAVQAVVDQERADQDRWTSHERGKPGTPPAREFQDEQQHHRREEPPKGCRHRDQVAHSGPQSAPCGCKSPSIASCEAQALRNQSRRGEKCREVPPPSKGNPECKRAGK